MKREDLEKLGLSKEQIDSVFNMHHTEFRAVKENLQKAQDELKLEHEKVDSHRNTITELKKDLEGFKDVDVSALNQKIAELQEDLKAKDIQHSQELADRDFQSILKDSIAEAKGKDTEKIMKLLDVELLKSSKNQKDDIAAAIKAMTEDEVTKGMFDTADTQTEKTGSIIGAVTGDGVNAVDAQMRAVMGLPPVTTEQK